MVSASDEVLALEDRRWAAMRANDVSALAPLMADGLVYTHSRGKVDDRQAVLDATGRLRFSSIELSDRRVSVVGATVVISGAAQIGFLAGGEQLERTIRYTSVWALEGERWSFAAFHSTPLPT